jgi:hypothetical protein
VNETVDERDIERRQERERGKERERERPSVPLHISTEDVRSTRYIRSCLIVTERKR